MSDISAAEQIDDIINQYDGWKNEVLNRLRSIIIDADPDIVEEVKWKMPSNPKGLPVWSCGGIVCLAQTFKDNIKLVFFQGPHLLDPNNLFNARLKGSVRAIEFHDGDPINETSLKELVAEAVRYNINKANH